MFAKHVNDHFKTINKSAITFVCVSDVTVATLLKVKDDWRVCIHDIFGGKNRR